jgi:hypothetical protein
MFKMTKEKALKIQAEQVVYYSQWVPDLADRVAAITRADELDDGEHEIYIINRYIPRGFDIEQIVEKQGKARFSYSD